MNKNFLNTMTKKLITYTLIGLLGISIPVTGLILNSMILILIGLIPGYLGLVCLSACSMGIVLNIQSKHKIKEVTNIKTNQKEIIQEKIKFSKINRIEQLNIKQNKNVKIRKK